MNDCTFIRETLASLAAAGAGADACDVPAELQAHLKGCSQCAAAFHEWRLIASGLRSTAQVPEEEIGDADVARVRARLHMALEAESRWDAWRSVGVWGGSVAAAAAALFVLLLRPIAPPTLPRSPESRQIAVAQDSDAIPTLLAFRNAMSESEESLEAMLDRDSARAANQRPLQLAPMGLSSLLSANP